MRDYPPPRDPQKREILGALKGVKSTGRVAAPSRVQGIPASSSQKHQEMAALCPSSWTNVPTHGSAGVALMGFDLGALGAPESPFFLGPGGGEIIPHKSLLPINNWP